MRLSQPCDVDELTFSDDILTLCQQGLSEH
ncbi:hypothetical protein P3T35_004630 [Kitasatospora sp. GP30]|nr:hypothetical protein [Kitasatospora sp. GP30]